MTNLMAFAAVRRLLAELGRPLLPDTPHPIGPIDLWLTTPRKDLDGASPAQRYADWGDAVLRECLVADLASLAPAEVSSNIVSEKPPS